MAWIAPLSVISQVENRRSNSQRKCVVCIQSQLFWGGVKSRNEKDTNLYGRKEGERNRRKAIGQASAASFWRGIGEGRQKNGGQGGISDE